MQPSPRNSFIKTIFLSRDERRLRAGWRLLIQTFFMLVFLLFVTAPVQWGVQTVRSFFHQPLSLDTNSLELFTWQLVEFISILLSVYLSRRFLDKRSFASLGLTINKKGLLEFLAGLFITFLQFGLIFALMVWQGWIQLEGTLFQSTPGWQVFLSMLYVVIVFSLVGWNEELLLRGYHLQTLASGTNLAFGIILSSMIFSLLHINNPGSSMASLVGILLAGLFMAFGYLRTRRLWLPIGLHIGWNIFEGAIFGFPVSGMDYFPRVMQIKIIGADIWTGGAFGPEAGLVVLPAIGLGVLLITIFTRHSNSELQTAVPKPSK